MVSKTYVTSNTFYLSIYVNCATAALTIECFVSVLAPSMQSFIITISLSAYNLCSAFSPVQGKVFISSIPFVLVEQLLEALALMILRISTSLILCDIAWHCSTVVSVEFCPSVFKHLNLAKMGSTLRIAYASAVQESC